MKRREFLGMAAAATLVQAAGRGGVSEAQAQSAGKMPVGAKAEATPMELGLVISPYTAPEETIRRVHDLGFPTCFLSLDGYIGKFTRENADLLGGLLTKYGVRATTVEVVRPEPLVWDFLKGPTTIGLVPRATRAARIEALVGVSEFAKMLRVSQVQTHCGFIPGGSGGSAVRGDGDGDPDGGEALRGEWADVSDGDGAGDADDDVAHAAGCRADRTWAWGWIRRI